MTKQQIIWASQHDWYICQDGMGGVVVCEHTAQGFVNSTFSDFQELRAWAGY